MCTAPCLRPAAVALAVFLAGAARGLAADTFCAVVDATGRATFQADGRRATVRFEAEATLTGTLTVDGVRLTFVAAARAVGAQTVRTSEHAAWWIGMARAVGGATASLDTPPTEAWIVLSGCGTTDAGEKVCLSGGLSLAAQDGESVTIAPTDAVLGLFAPTACTGRFYLLLAAPDGPGTCPRVQVVEGDATGTVQDSYAERRAPDSWEMERTWSVTLSGAARPWSSAAGTPSEWPSGLLDVMDSLDAEDR